jgi:hypothetical protein
MEANQRLEVYCEIERLLKTWIGQGYGMGFCYALKKIRFNGGSIEYYPELIKRKPKVTFSCVYWFDITDYGLRKRLEIIKECKEEINTFLKTSTT